MKTIRMGTFETNSSSTHSITMCMAEEYEKWKNGEMYYDRWNGELVSKAEVEKVFAKWREDFIADNPGFDENDEEWQEKLEEYMDEDKQYYTYEEFNGYEMEFETYETEFETPKGEKVVSFGYYGNDW